MKNRLSLRGLREILLPRPGVGEFLETPGAPARAAFGPVLGAAAGSRGRDLAAFLGQVALFEGFGSGELDRLARSAHERSYRDGERIYEQGRPGAALFIVRSGVVEITRHGRGGEEVALVTLEPPASFSEQAAIGGDVARWTSAVARGPVSLVAFGSSDLEAIGRRFPHLANKILRKLAQIMALRLQLLIDAEFFPEEAEDPTGDHQK